MKAPNSYIHITQTVTVATVTYYKNGYVKGVDTFHHPVPQRVYFRGGKRKCIESFRSKANATRSMSAGR